MPIREENHHHYKGEAWKAVREAMLARSGNCCEGSPTYPDCRAANGQPHPVTHSKVVLTIAHLDHNGRRLCGDRFVMPYYKSGSGLTGRHITRPIGTLTTRARWGVVDGERMRMLHVDEGKAAMTFPPGYLLPENQKLANHLLGNAVCPAQGEDAITQLLRCA